MVSSLARTALIIAGMMALCSCSDGAGVYHITHAELDAISACYAELKTEPYITYGKNFENRLKTAPNARPLASDLVDFAVYRKKDAECKALYSRMSELAKGQSNASDLSVLLFARQDNLFNEFAQGKLSFSEFFVIMKQIPNDVNFYLIEMDNIFRFYRGRTASPLYIQESDDIKNRYTATTESGVVRCKWAGLNLVCKN